VDCDSWQRQPSRVGPPDVRDSEDAPLDRCRLLRRQNPSFERDDFGTLQSALWMSLVPLFQFEPGPSRREVGVRAHVKPVVDEVLPRFGLIGRQVPIVVGERPAGPQIIARSSVAISTGLRS
jgi:hypothetical protein